MSSLPCDFPWMYWQTAWLAVVYMSCCVKQCLKFFAVVGKIFSASWFALLIFPRIHYLVPFEGVLAVHLLFYATSSVCPVCILLCHIMFFWYPTALSNYHHLHLAIFMHVCVIVFTTFQFIFIADFFIYVVGLLLILVALHKWQHLLCPNSV